MRKVFLLVFRRFLFQVCGASVYVLLRVDSRLVYPHFLHLFMVKEGVLFSMGHLLVQYGRRSGFAIPIKGPLLQYHGLQYSLYGLSFYGRVYSLVVVGIQFRTMGRPIVQASRGLIISKFFAGRLWVYRTKGKGRLASGQGHHIGHTLRRFQVVSMVILHRLQGLY